MPTVDFYVLKNNAPQAMFLAACQLAEETYLAKKTTYLLVTTPEEMKTIDTLLWTFHDTSFIPHDLISPDHASKNSNLIHIGNFQDPQHNYDVLINLTDHFPATFNKFKHILEIVPPDPEARAGSRLRYKDYQQQGFEIKTLSI